MQHSQSIFLCILTSSCINLRKLVVDFLAILRYLIHYSWSLSIILLGIYERYCTDQGHFLVVGTQEVPHGSRKAHRGNVWEEGAAWDIKGMLRIHFLHSLPSIIPIPALLPSLPFLAGR